MIASEISADIGVRLEWRVGIPRFDDMGDYLSPVKGERMHGKRSGKWASKGPQGAVSASRPDSSCGAGTTRRLRRRDITPPNRSRAVPIRTPVAGSGTALSLV
jgi:hypothetical protein